MNGQRQEPEPTDSASVVRCLATIYGDGRGGQRCARKAKVERNGKWYCRQHDPEARKAFDAERTAKWKREWNIRGAMGALENFERQAGKALADYAGGDLPAELAAARQDVLAARDILRGLNPESGSVVLAVDPSRSTPAPAVPPLAPEPRAR